MTPLLAAEGVSRVIGARILLHPLNLAVAAGELVVVVGPNGAGKSTLLALLSGEVPPSAGRVFYDGRDVRAWPARRLAAKRAVMAQSHALAFPFTVAELVGIGLDGAGPALSRARREDAIADALARADVLRLADRDVQTLSGGERQRAQFARALAQLSAGRAAAPGAQIALLDEPVASLDPEHQLSLMEAARALAEDGLAVVAVLHDLNLAALYADRLIALRDGRLVADGPPGAVLDDAFVRDVFGVALTVRRHEANGTPFVLPERPRRRA